MMKLRLIVMKRENFIRTGEHWVRNKKLLTCS